MRISGGVVPPFYVQENWSPSLSRSTQWRLGEFGGRVPPNYVQVFVS